MSSNDIPETLLRQVDQSVTMTTIDASSLARQRIEQTLLADVPRAKGLDAVVESSKAMSADLRNLTDTLKTQAQAQALFQTNFTSTMSTLRDEIRTMTTAITESTREVVTRRGATGPGVQPGVAAGVRESFQPSMGPPSAEDAARGQSEGYGHWRAEELRSAMRSSGDYRDAPHRKYGSENIIASVVASEQDAGGDRVSTDDVVQMQREAEFQYGRERLRGARGAGLGGLRQEVMSGAARRLSETDPTSQSGRLLRTVVGGMADPNPRESMLRSAGMTRYGGAALRVAGTGAMVLGAADQIGDFAESQRAQNATYQRALGGTNAEGFIERGRERLFGLSQFGVMGDQQASELYRGVTQLGLRGDDRQGALDFASDAYRRFGMDVRASVSLIEDARRRGVESFTDLTDALQRVTTSARDAGVNADMARQVFQQSFNTMAPTLGGTGAMIGAEASAAMLASMGPQFAGTSFGMNMDTIRLMASRNPNMSPADVLGAVEDPSGQFLTGAMQQSETQVRDRFLSQAPGLQQVVSQFMEGRDPNAQLLPGEVQALGEQIREAGGDAIDPEALIQQLADPTGLNWQGLTPNTVYDALGVVLADQGPSRSYERTIERRQRDLGTTTQRLDRSDPRSDDIARGHVGLARDVLLEGRYQDGILGIGGDDFRRGLGDQYARMAMDASEGRDELVGSGIMERFIEMSDSDSRYVVQTPQGDRVVTAEEAMRYYPDQIQSGSIRAFNGPKEGQSLSDVFGFEQGSLEGVAFEGEEAPEDVGRSIDQARAERAGTDAAGGGQGTGRVTVVPHPSLNGILQFQSQGAVEVAYSNWGGTPPGPYDPHIGD